MPTIKDIYDQIKTAVVGTKTADIDAKLDNALNSISSYRSQMHRNSHIELIKNLMSKSGFDSSMFGAASPTTTTPAAMGQGGRLQRYKMYESITGNINYCQRALQVLTDNIISPDDITKTSLEVTPVKFLEDENDADSNVRNVIELIEKTKLEKALDIIIKNTLHFGDFFCEIADDKTALISRSMIITENLESHNNDSGDFIRIKEGGIDRNIFMDYSTFTEDNNKKISLNNINLLYYDPKRVVKIQSNMFPICFGYLIFPIVTIAPHLMIQDQIINMICSNILKSMVNKIPNIDINNVDADDLKDTIKYMVKETDPSKMLNIRYVPPDKMVHFMIPSTKYFPYGESIFDSSQLTAKMLIALEVALSIQRMNRSIEKRKVSVELGIQRDGRKAIELLKEEFKKRKISLDSFGTIDTIPSMIGSFEDVYVPQKDGKAFVDISPFSDAGAETRSKVEELKFLRDQIVAGTGVPPAYVGIDEQTSNRNMLTDESAQFARSIINHQKYFTHYFQELVQKMYALIDPEKSITILDNVNVSLPAPKSLQFSRESEAMTNLANLVETLERIGIPKEYSKKKYLTSIDWKEVEKYQNEDKIDKSLNTTPEGEKSNDSFGGFGLGSMNNFGGGGFNDNGTGGGGGIPGI